MHTDLPIGTKLKGKNLWIKRSSSIYQCVNCVESGYWRKGDTKEIQSNQEFEKFLSKGDIIIYPFSHYRTLLK